MIEDSIPIPLAILIPMNREFGCGNFPRVARATFVASVAKQQGRERKLKGYQPNAIFSKTRRTGRYELSYP
jgi:hypothetical protein